MGTDYIPYAILIINFSHPASQFDASQLAKEYTLQYAVVQNTQIPQQLNAHQSHHHTLPDEVWMRQKVSLQLLSLLYIVIKLRQ